MWDVVLLYIQQKVNLIVVVDGLLSMKVFLELSKSYLILTVEGSRSCVITAVIIACVITAVIIAIIIIDEKLKFVCLFTISNHTIGSHLGHVFKGEGFSTPTDERYKHIYYQ